MVVCGCASCLNAHVHTGVGMGWDGLSLSQSGLPSRTKDPISVTFDSFFSKKSVLLTACNVDDVVV